MKTPVSLLERLRSPDDAEAWSRFLALYTPLLYSLGRRVGLQDQDAADLVQKVLLVLVTALPTFAYDRLRSFRRWLRTVALNKWRDRCKSLASIWEVGSSKLLRTLPSPGAGPVNVCWWTTGEHLIPVGIYTGTAEVMDAVTGKVIRRLDGKPHCWPMAFAWSPDGKKLLTAFRDHAPAVLDFTTGKLD
jgi:hypothetical protein